MATSDSVSEMSASGEFSGELERVIAGIWQELLGVETVGSNEDFFELGGDSLLGQQLMARIRDRVQIDPPLLLLFEAPTVRELAEAITELIIEEVEEMS